MPPPILRLQLNAPDAPAEGGPPPSLEELAEGNPVLKGQREFEEEPRVGI